MSAGTSSCITLSRTSSLVAVPVEGSGRDEVTVEKAEPAGTGSRERELEALRHNQLL